jgi:hypothetical protein
MKGLAEKREKVYCYFLLKSMSIKPQPLRSSQLQFSFSKKSLCTICNGYFFVPMCENWPKKTTLLCSRYSKDALQMQNNVHLKSYFSTVKKF